MIGNGRLESQIAALGETLSRRLKRLRESTLDVYADLGLKNVYRDWDTFDPEIYPVANYIPPFYQDKRLRGETIPLYQNEYQLKVIRDKSRVLCALNEYAICGIENRKNYIIGTGLTYTAYPRDPNLAKHKKLCNKLQDFLDLVDDYADLDEHAAEDLERQDEDGESFTRLFFKSNGMTEVRFIEPEYVCSPHGMTDDPQTSFGIITPPDDTAVAEAYTVGNMPYPKVPTNWEEIPASEIVHNKNRSKKANKRGVPLFTPAMNKLKRAEEMLDSLSTMAKARAKIALIRQITGLTQDTATRLQSLLTKVRVTDPYTNEVLNIDQLRNGTILTTNQNGGYQFPSANVEANQFVEVLQAELRGVAGMLQMPEWMLTAVADAKYSNAFVVEGTAYRAFTRIQNKLCKRYGSARFGNQQSVVWRMVKHAIEAGLLPYEVLECCRIEAAGPTLKTRNDAEEANTNKTYIEMGVRSKRTVQERIGDDPDTENAYLLAEQRQKNRERVAESPQAILQIQTAYTKGEIARPAAIGLAMTVYGFTSDDCDKLFPTEPGKDLTAAGNKPQQPPGGGPGEPPGGLPTPDTADQGDSGGNPLDTFPRFTESTIRVGSLSRHTKILLREAGFTGTVTAKNGAVFYYEDGRRVANPNKKEGPKKAQHHTADKAKGYQTRAIEAFDYAINNQEKLTPEHVRSLPKILAVLPKAKLEEYASKLGYKVKEKYKQDVVDKIAKLFPVPMSKPTEEKPAETPGIDAVEAAKEAILSASSKGELKSVSDVKNIIHAIQADWDGTGPEPTSDNIAKKLGFKDGNALFDFAKGYEKAKPINQPTADEENKPQMTPTDFDPKSVADQIKEDAVNGTLTSQTGMIDYVHRAVSGHAIKDEVDAVANEFGYKTWGDLLNATSGKQFKDKVNDWKKQVKTPESAPTPKPAEPTPIEAASVGGKTSADYFKIAKELYPGLTSDETVQLANKTSQSFKELVDAVKNGTDAETLAKAFIKTNADDMHVMLNTHGVVDAITNPNTPGVDADFAKVLKSAAGVDSTPVEAPKSKTDVVASTKDFIPKAKFEKLGKTYGASATDSAHKITHLYVDEVLSGKKTPSEAAHAFYNDNATKLADVALTAYGVDSGILEDESDYIAELKQLFTDAKNKQTTEVNQAINAKQQANKETPNVIEGESEHDIASSTGTKVSLENVKPETDYTGKSPLEIDGWEELDKIHPSKQAYGAVVTRVNPETGETEILLREPTNHFDGYVWTFPKGKSDGMLPADTAHKELGEETGYSGKIVGHIPELFGSSGTTKNAFFMMEHDGSEQDKSKLDKETASVKWVSIDKAHELINQTTKAAGKARDLKILDAAKNWLAASKEAKEYPTSPDQTKEVKSLGGSTGAKLVDFNGKKFVKKSGANPGHVQEEHTADTLYRILGANVPKAKLYDGKTKLAEYVDGHTLNNLSGAEAQKAYGELRKHFVADALFGNWDVAGLNLDNVLVDKSGKVYRIDNGGSLRYRAQGAKKTPEQFGSKVTELDSLRNASINPNTAKIFKGITDQEIHSQITDILSKKDQLLAAVKDPALKKTLEARIGDLASRLPGKPMTINMDTGSHTVHTKFDHNFFNYAPKASYGTSPQTLKYLELIDNEDVQGIKYYTNGGYSSLNEALYEKKGVESLPLYQQGIDKRLQTAFAKVPKLDTPITVYRGIGLSGEKLTKFLEVLTRKQKSGNPIDWRSYQSTGSIKEKAWGGNIKFEIRNVTEGAIDVNPITSNPGESEILLNRGTRYKIVSITSGGGKHHIVMEQVPSAG